MKPILLTICTIVLLIACHPREAQPTENSGGTLTCKLNGKEWVRLFSKGYQSAVGGTLSENQGKNCSQEFAMVGSSLFNKNKMLEYELILDRIPLISGKYPITSHDVQGDCLKNLASGRFGTIDQGDIAGDIYYSIPNPDSYISVESYNKETKIIKGTFDMVAVVSRIGSGHHLPDTLRFTEGRFAIRVEE